MAIINYFNTVSFSIKYHFEDVDNDKIVHKLKITKVRRYNANYEYNHNRNTTD